MARTILLLMAMLLPAGLLSAQNDLAKRASWAPPVPAVVKAQVLDWVATQKLDEVKQLEIDALWPAEVLPQAGRGTLEHLAATIAAVDSEAKPLVELCRGAAPVLLPPAPEMLIDEARSPFVRHNLRLYYASWLVQASFYDEAAQQLEGLQHGDVVDPGSLLFYQSVVYHRLLKKGECLAALETLLENEDALPRRYLSVAKLMEADIMPLKVDSLDEVSRLMDDIRRRLGFGRAGTRVRKQEDDVIAKLDKMIEELEKQRQQQQQQSGAGNANNLQPNTPAEDSFNAGGKGPGDVDPRKLANKSNWGNLPPKDRQEALQQISKDLPAHFREVIEEYFRKLANDRDN